MHDRLNHEDAIVHVLAGDLFVIGGYDGNAVNTVEKFNPTKSLWSEGPSLSETRYSASSATLDDVIYVFGGG